MNPKGWIKETVDMWQHMKEMIHISIQKLLKFNIFQNWINDYNIIIIFAI